MEISESEAFRKVSAFCSCAEHCRSEVVEKLQRWGIAYKTIDEIIARLVAEKFIDEERYSRAFIRDKYRFDKWGKVKIAQALSLKKIPRFTFQRFLDEIDREEYLAILNGLLASKRKSIRAADEYELNGKLVRFALSRGFEMDDIRCCMDVSEENEALS